jgi:peptidoglycan/xylan/chitin deacetylase (PgdA/CDA1 family)
VPTEPAHSTSSAGAVEHAAAPLPAGSRRALLVRERDLQDNEAPGPRQAVPAGGLLRWARWALLPMSSAIRAQTLDRVVSLTYDDGPNPDQTPGILDALREHGARATFFVLTGRAQEHPEIIRRMLAEGHEVALHGIDHARLTSVPGLEAARRIREGKRRLDEVTGQRTRLYRPTYGAQGMAQYLATRLSGMDVVIWSAWARDWQDDAVEAVAGRVVHALHPGAVVLLHDTTDDTREEDVPRPTFSRPEVTRRILEAMAEGGYTSVPAGELLARYPAVRAVTTQRPRLPGRR